jgi:hypothetical protein
MDLAVEMGIIINTIQESLRRKTISLKNGVPRAPVETIDLPPASTNGSSKLNKSKPPLQQRRPTRGTKANMSQVRLNTTGINFPDPIFPAKNKDENRYWEEIVLAVVLDQGQVRLEHLASLAKVGQGVIHRFAISTLGSVPIVRDLFAAAIRLQEQKMIKWPEKDLLERVDWK